MPQTKIDLRCFSEPRKCDVPASNFVTSVEVKDESSPECSPPLNGFFRSGQTSKSGVSQDICHGRNTEDNVSQSALSNDNDQENPTRNCDLDLHPSNLLNGQHFNNESVNFENQNKCDFKTLFSESLLNSLTSEPHKENGMKIINDSISQDFSDLLSSLPNHESKDNSKLHFTNFEALDKHGVDVEFHNISNYSDDFKKPNGVSTQSKGTLSDILSSISFDEPDSSQTGAKNSSNASQCFTANQIPPFNKLDPEFFKHNDLESNNGTLSDILSSISADEIHTSIRNGYISPSTSSLSLNNIDIPNELDPDFANINFHTADNISKLNASNLESSGNLSDILSSITFHENDITAQSGLKSTSFFSSDPNQGFESDSLFTLKELSSELLCSDDKVKLSMGKTTDCKIFSFPSIVNNTSSSINTPKTSGHNKSSIHDEKNREFSFFSNSPDNVFSAMLSNLSKTSDSQDKNTNEYSSEISMLDLLKSVNTDSNGSLSEYLSIIPIETKTDEQVVDTVLNEILNIDLSACIKTSDDSINMLHHEPPVNKVCIAEKDDKEIQLGGFMKPVFDNVDPNCPKPPRMNLNQSLFSKSLSCKPKKNWIILQKVALIQSQLYEHYFNHNISDDIESKMDKNNKWTKDGTNKETVICKMNDGMIRFKGRRKCPQEVQ